jgi:hypothetical protein
MMTVDNIDKSEVEFELIGLDSFFNEVIDKNINWEEFFQLTSDEQFSGANNNTICEIRNNS